MKRVGLLIVIMFVLSAAVYAQTITITLSDVTTGRVVSNEAGVDTTAWFRSTTTTPGLSGLPWLVAGNYTGQVSKKGSRDAIIIFGGPNNIASERGIFIHIGNSPSDSDGCVVIAGAQTGGAMHTLYSELSKNYGLHRGTFTIRVIDNRPTQTTNNNSQMFNFEGTWVGVDNNYSYIFSGSNYTVRQNNSGWVNVERGTFFVNAGKTKFTQSMTHYWDGGWVAERGSAVFDLTISDNHFTITGYTEVNGNFSETYSKQ
ncbi:MAG: hypothetical protein LBG26_03760 [Treponema sp.]|jgi:hypothetical protein|nr:hypothetical protein [Treponema sp.]